MNSNASSADQRSKNPSEGRNQGARLDFRCSDVGPKNCNWQLSGNSEQEMLPQIEQHGREAHGMTIDNQTRDRVRTAIHRKAA